MTADPKDEYDLLPGVHTVIFQPEGESVCPIISVGQWQNVRLVNAPVPMANGWWRARFIIADDPPY